MPECPLIKFTLDFERNEVNVTCKETLKYSPDDGPYTLQGAPPQPIRHQAYQSKPG